MYLVYDFHNNKKQRRDDDDDDDVICVITGYKTSLNNFGDARPPLGHVVSTHCEIQDVVLGVGQPASSNRGRDAMLVGRMDMQFYCIIGSCNRYKICTRINAAMLYCYGFRTGQV